MDGVPPADNPAESASKALFAPGPLRVDAPGVTYTDSEIVSRYRYDSTAVVLDPLSGAARCTPVSRSFTFATKRAVPKTGLMVVGWGGNNGTTITGGILANRRGVTWRTRTGETRADWLGSLTQAATVRLGTSTDGRDVYTPLKSLLPMLDPCELAVGGWDISGMAMGKAMARAGVFDVGLQDAIRADMDALGAPLPSIYYPDFIAANQADRADNLLPGSDKQAHVDALRGHIRGFKSAQGVDKVIMLWSANTERFADILPGVNDTADALLAAIRGSHPEIAPSTVFAVAAILEGCTFINGSPQNTFVPGCIELALRHKVFIAGDDFKTGQTRLKSVLADFLVSAGLKPESIVSYNHLGNNDGRNLSAPQQFRSKEISKRSVVDDTVESNPIMYGPGEHPDHVIVIKYVPHVGDSKRAMDEYTSRIFCGGSNTIAIHNTCEDSLLAAPIMIDLVVLAELCERITVRPADEGAQAAEPLHPVLSLLSYCLKAPLVPSGTPVVNALFKQREALVNVMRACVGLPPENYMKLEHRLRSAGTPAALAAVGLADAALKN